MEGVINTLCSVCIGSLKLFLMLANWVHNLNRLRNAKTVREVNVMHRVRSCRDRKAHLSVLTLALLWLLPLALGLRVRKLLTSHMLKWHHFLFSGCASDCFHVKKTLKDSRCLEGEVKTHYFLVDTHELRRQILIVPGPSSKIGGWLRKEAWKHYIHTYLLHVLCSHLCSRSYSEELPKTEMVHLSKSESLYQWTQSLLPKCRHSPRWD